MASAQHQEKLAIIAGGGPLPLQLARACASTDRPYHIIGLNGMAEPEIDAHPHTWSHIGTVGETLKVLKRENCRAVIMAGIVKRPNFSQLKLDLTGTRLLPRIAKAARGGDDQLLRALVSYFEEQGFRVEGVDQVMNALLAPEGTLTAAAPDEDAWRDIAIAARVVLALGELDVGQGAVVANRLVLAVEAAEGTDAMLRRCADLPEHLRGTDEARSGVLVKLAKPGQERRIDLPTIGIDTVHRAADAGLAGIAVEAGAALILDRAEVIAQADRRGIFIHGLAPGEAEAGQETEPPR